MKMREDVSPRLLSAMSLTVAALFLVAGCGGEPEPLPNAATPAQPANPVAAPTAPTALAAPAAATGNAGAASAASVSEAEAEAFAKNLQNAFAAGDEATISRLIDWARMADRACDALPASAEELAGMKHGLALGLSGRAQTGVGFIPEVLRNASQGGDYSFVRIEEKDGKRYALFRLVAAEGGLNYHRYLLEHTPPGNVIASDIYIQAVGEFVSESARKTLLTMLSSRSNSLLDRLTGADRDLIASSKTMAQMGSARVQGRYAEVLRLYETLPKTLKRSKACLIMKVMAAQQVDAQQYLAAMQEFRKLYPGDSALAMILLDYYFLKGDYDEALKTVERFDTDVRDPYLNIFRANAYLSKKDYPEARRHIDQFVADFPQLANAHDTQATIALAQGDFPAVTEALKVLHSKFGIDVAAATNLPLYAPYKKSQEYDKLNEYLKGETDRRSP